MAVGVLMNKSRSETNGQILDRLNDDKLNRKDISQGMDKIKMARIRSCCSRMGNLLLAS